MILTFSYKSNHFCTKKFDLCSILICQYTVKSSFNKTIVNVLYADELSWENSIFAFNTK